MQLPQSTQTAHPLSSLRDTSKLKFSGDKTLTIFRKKIKVQHIIIGTVTAAVTIGSLLLGDKEHEDATRSH